MASEPRTKTSNELALDIVEKIDAYLDGSITGEDVIAWAGTFFARTWLSSEVVVESAIDALMAVGPMSTIRPQKSYKGSVRIF